MVFEQILESKAVTKLRSDISGQQVLSRENSWRGPKAGSIKSKKVRLETMVLGERRDKVRRKGRREETKVSLGTRRPRACFLEGMVRYWGFQIKA